MKAIFKFSITQIHRPFLWLLLDLKLPNIGRKLKQLLEIPILTRELYIFTRKDLCFGTGRKSFAKYFLSEFSGLKINPRRKNYISGYIWHRSFIHTVKCSFLDEKCVYQSFYDAPFPLSYFLLQGKVLCFSRVGKSLVRCLLSEAADQTWWKKLYLRSYLTQIVHSNGKMLFSWQKICLPKFLWCAVHVKLFFTSRKSSVFRTRQQVACEIFICRKRSEHLVEKKIISGCFLLELFIQNGKMLFL